MLDDYVVLFGEQGISQQHRTSDLFVSPQGTFYRPVGHLFLRLSSLLFGTNVVGYHLANLALFFLICMMFFLITELLFKNWQLSLLTTLLYALHPINGWLVNYVTANVIATFVLNLELSLVFFILFLDHRKKSSYWFSLFFFALALFSHEMSVVFPVFLLCLLYFLKKFSLWGSLRLGLPYILMSFFYALLRLSFFSFSKRLSGTMDAVGLSLGGYFATLMDLIFWYVSKLLFMKEIIFLWNGVMVTDQLMFRMVVGAAVIATLLWLIFVQWRKGIHAFSLALFVSGFIPMGFASFAYFSVSGSPIVEPHWFHFSSLGFFLLLASGILTLRKWVKGTVWIVIVTGILATNLVVTRHYNTLWRDQETYCRYWLSVNGEDWTPYWGLGKSLLEKGDYPAATTVLENGFRTNPYSHLILTDLGYAYFIAGRFEDSLRAYQVALGLDPNHTLAYHRKGELFLATGDYREAELALLSALELNPSAPPSYELLMEVHNRVREQNQ